MGRERRNKKLVKTPVPSEKPAAKKARLQQAASKKATVKKPAANKKSKTRGKLKPKQWIEAFVRGIVVLQLQDFLLQFQQL